MGQNLLLWRPGLTTMLSAIHVTLCYYTVFYTFTTPFSVLMEQDGLSQWVRHEDLTILDFDLLEEQIPAD